MVRIVSSLLLLVANAASLKGLMGEKQLGIGVGLQIVSFFSFLQFSAKDMFPKKKIGLKTEPFAT